MCTESGRSTLRNINPELINNGEKPRCGPIEREKPQPTVKRVIAGGSTLATLINDRMAGGKGTTLRRCPSLRAIHGRRPCRYPIFHTLMAGESRELCAERHNSHHTLEVLRGLEASHPGVFTLLSPGLPLPATSSGSDMNCGTPGSGDVQGCTRGGVLGGGMVGRVYTHHVHPWHIGRCIPTMYTPGIASLVHPGIASLLHPGYVHPMHTRGMYTLCTPWVYTLWYTDMHRGTPCGTPTCTEVHLRRDLCADTSCSLMVRRSLCADTSCSPHG